MFLFPYLFDLIDPHSRLNVCYNSPKGHIIFSPFLSSLKLNVALLTFDHKCLNNKINHIINGNNNIIKGLKLLHLNKGNSNFLTKITLIKNLINDEKCDVASFVESNVLSTDPDQLKPITGFNHEHKFVKVGPIMSDTARTTMIIREDITYKRRLDLESDINSLIWVEITLGAGPHLLVMSGYRQWQLPCCFKAGNSKEKHQQLNRFRSYLF